jgi:hypothetical protein
MILYENIIYFLYERVYLAVLLKTNFNEKRQTIIRTNSVGRQASRMNENYLFHRKVINICSINIVFVHFQLVLVYSVQTSAADNSRLYTRKSSISPLYGDVLI